MVGITPGRSSRGPQLQPPCHECQVAESTKKTNRFARVRTTTNRFPAVQSRIEPKAMRMTIGAKRSMLFSVRKSNSAAPWSKWCREPFAPVAGLYYASEPVLVVDDIDNRSDRGNRSVNEGFTESAKDPDDDRQDGDQHDRFGPCCNADGESNSREFPTAVDQELDRQDDSQRRQRLSEEILTVRQMRKCRTLNRRRSPTPSGSRPLTSALFERVRRRESPLSVASATRRRTLRASPDYR